MVHTKQFLPFIQFSDRPSKLCRIPAIVPRTSTNTCFWMHRFEIPQKVNCLREFVFSMLLFCFKKCVTSVHSQYSLEGSQLQIYTLKEFVNATYVGDISNSKFRRNLFWEFQIPYNHKICLKFQNLKTTHPNTTLRLSSTSSLR